MESIDVRDLPEEQARLVQDFVAFLRARLRSAQPEAPPAETPPALAVWPLVVKGTLRQEEIYEHF